MLSHVKSWPKTIHLRNLDDYSFRNSIFFGVSKVGQTTETHAREKRLATLSPSKIQTWLLSKISLNNQYPATVKSKQWHPARNRRGRYTFQQLGNATFKKTTSLQLDLFVLSSIPSSDFLHQFGCKHSGPIFGPQADETVALYKKPSFWTKPPFFAQTLH